MRRHVNRMGRIRRNGGVTARGGKALGRQALFIGGVNQIVCNAGVAGIFLEKRIENGNGLLAQFKCSWRIFLIGKRNKRERVEAANFDIPRNGGIPLFERRGVRGDARLFIELVTFLKEDIGGVGALQARRRARSRSRR